VFNILFFPKTLESMRLVETCKGDDSTGACLVMTSFSDRWEGVTGAYICREHGISDATFYIWAMHPGSAPRNVPSSPPSCAPSCDSEDHLATPNSPIAGSLFGFRVKAWSSRSDGIEGRPKTLYISSSNGSTRLSAVRKLLDPRRVLRGYALLRRLQTQHQPLWRFRSPHLSSSSTAQPCFHYTGHYVFVDPKATFSTPCKSGALRLSARWARDCRI